MDVHRCIHMYKKRIYCDPNHTEKMLVLTKYTDGDAYLFPTNQQKEVLSYQHQTIRKESRNCKGLYRFFWPTTNLKIYQSSAACALTLRAAASYILKKGSTTVQHGVCPKNGLPTHTLIAISGVERHRNEYHRFFDEFDLSPRFRGAWLLDSTDGPRFLSLDFSRSNDTSSVFSMHCRISLEETPSQRSLPRRAVGDNCMRKLYLELAEQG